MSDEDETLGLRGEDERYSARGGGGGGADDNPWSTCTLCNFTVLYHLIYVAYTKYARLHAAKGVQTSKKLQTARETHSLCSLAGNICSRCCTHHSRRSNLRRTAQPSKSCTAVAPSTKAERHPLAATA